MNCNSFFSKDKLSVTLFVGSFRRVPNSELADDFPMYLRSRVECLPGNSIENEPLSEPCAIYEHGSERGEFQLSYQEACIYLTIIR